MKLVTYKKDDFAGCGIWASKGIIDIKANWSGSNPPQTVMEILERGESCFGELRKLVSNAKKIIPVEDVKIIAPLPRPGKVIGLAGNYFEHIKEVGLTLGLSDSPRNSTVPRPFIMPATAVTGPDEEIEWPDYSKEIDYEIELGVVIGKKIKRVNPKEAEEAIAGYTIVNDISARSVTFKKNRKNRPWDEFYDWLNGKWADGFLPMGPFLLTADEIVDVQNLNMELRVNDEVRQKANTSQMIYPVTDVVSFLSHIMTLEPGDVIATGTPAGVGMATKNFLKDGDKIECTIEKLGTLSNRLGKRPAQFYEPLATQ